MGKYHKVPKDSRYLNSYDLEIRRLGYIKKKKAVKN